MHPVLGIPPQLQPYIVSVEGNSCKVDLAKYMRDCKEKREQDRWDAIFGKKEDTGEAQQD